MDKFFWVAFNLSSSYLNSLSSLLISLTFWSIYFYNYVWWVASSYFSEVIFLFISVLIAYLLSVISLIFLLRELSTYFSFYFSSSSALLIYCNLISSWSSLALVCKLSYFNLAKSLCYFSKRFFVIVKFLSRLIYIKWEDCWI